MKRPDRVVALSFVVAILAAFGLFVVYLRGGQTQLEGALLFLTLGGIGVVLNGDDRAQYTYCHGQPGTHAVAVGDHVTVGQYLMNSASTGNSTGPHLHFGIESAGTKRCPQAFLVAIAHQQLPDPSGLPTSGCTN